MLVAAGVTSFLLAGLLGALLFLSAADRGRMRNTRVEVNRLNGELRVIDSPLAESCIVGVAIGAAVNGMKPIAEIQFADFIAPAMNQIIEEAARFCYRTAGDFNLPMVIRAPWGGGVHGALYHSQSIEATFGHIPGLKVVVPGTPADAKGLLKAAVRDPDPVLYLEHKRTYRLVKGEVPDGDRVVPIGKADCKREGKDLTLHLAT